MDYQFDFRPYQHPFARSLSTSHGTWNTREGIILRLTDETGQMGWGEIAPLPWFGSETLAQALDFCTQLPAKITAETIFSIPDTLPACQFGFESAWEEFILSPIDYLLPLNPTPPAAPLPVYGEGKGVGFNLGQITGDDTIPRSKHPPISSPIKGEGLGVRGGIQPNLLSALNYSALLPTGEAALHAWQPLWRQGYRTFKWKIGVASSPEELKVFENLIQALPESAKLRLDANGGLTKQEVNQWLQACDGSSIIEFLEQPLSVDQLDAMLELTIQYRTAIALDESVATLKQMDACYQQGWQGIFVIKPAIAGSPKQLRQFCQTHNIEAVFSSVFETTIGRQKALQLAAELSTQNRAVGFGINHWFTDDRVIVNFYNCT